MKLLQLVFVSLLTGAAAFSQSAAMNGQIEGTVSDPTGAVVAKVKVEAVNNQTGYKRSVETDASGVYRFALLPLGTYTISAEVTGFAPDKRTDISVNAGSTRTVDFQLSLAGTQRAITVTEDAPIVDPGRTDI